MIIRILSEGQYRLAGQHLDQLNEMDNRLVGIVAARNQEEFGRLFTQMLDLVRKNGEPVPVEELHDSDIILPPADLTLDEAEQYFAGDGIIPG